MNIINTSILSKCHQILLALLGITMAALFAPVTLAATQPLPFNQAAVKQSTAPAALGPNLANPYFHVRFALPVPPDNSDLRNSLMLGIDPAARSYNHSPGFEIMPNGDALFVTFSSLGVREAGPTLRLVQARLRHGAEEFDMPEEVTVQGVRMQDLLRPDGKRTPHASPLLWRDGTNVWLFTAHYTYPEEEQTAYFRVFKSTDSGATWTIVALEPRFFDQDGKELGKGGKNEGYPQPITSAFRDNTGHILVAIDGNTDTNITDVAHLKGFKNTSLLFRSPDNGLTWYDQGGHTDGRHSTIVPLDNKGKLLSIGGKDTSWDPSPAPGALVFDTRVGDGGYMPKNVSTNWGKTWGPPTQSDFAWLGGNQRPCAIKLANGNLIMVGDSRYNKTASNSKDMLPANWKYNDAPYVAISTNSGANWTIKPLPVCLQHHTRHHKTIGYSTVRQAPNGLIHILSTKTQPFLHYELNEKWITTSAAGDIQPETTGSSVLSYNEAYADGAPKATWRALRTPGGRYLLDGLETHFYPDGKKLREVTWAGGRRTGPETLWGADGTRIWSWTHDLANNVSTWTHWWPNGQKHIESQWNTRPTSRIPTPAHHDPFEALRIHPKDPANSTLDRTFRGLVAHGTARQWDTSGMLVEQYAFRDGARIYPQGNYTEDFNKTWADKKTAKPAPSTRGWTGSGNTTNGNNFIYSADTLGATDADFNKNTYTNDYLLGEVAGVFARSTAYSYYADTAIGTKYRTNTTLRFCGNWQLTDSTNFLGTFRIGYFNKSNPGSNFIGIEVREPAGVVIDPTYERSGTTFRGYLCVKGAGGTTMTSDVPVELHMFGGGTKTFDVIWKGNSNGSGTLSGTLTGVPVSLTVTNGSGTFDAFGILAGGDASSNPAKQTAQCYFDSFVYDRGTVTNYTVTYHANGGSGNAPSAEIKPKDVALPLSANIFNLVKADSTFAGWNTTSNGTGTAYAPGALYTNNANLTLYAKWNTTNTYTVSYYANGGTGTAPATQLKPHGAALTLALNSGNLAKANFSFAGWNTATNGAGTDYAPGSLYTNNAGAMLYAKWALIPSKTLKIMPMGDSITHGLSPSLGGYRYPLYNMLTNTGYRVDFVGDKTTTGDPCPDKNHWGQIGHQISETSTNSTPSPPISNRTYVSIQGLGRSGLYAEMSSAISTTYFSANTTTNRNIILLMIGINDVLHQVVDSTNGVFSSDAGTNGYGEGQDYVAEGMIARLKALLNSINGYAASRSLRIEVVLGTTCPLTKEWSARDPTNDKVSDVLIDEVAQYNGFISTVIPTMSFSHLSVKIVDHNSATIGKLADGVHPNSSGYTNMAQVWYQAISAPATCAVTFDAGVGATASLASKVVSVGAAYGALATATKSGQTFAGWWTAPNGGGTLVSETTPVPATANHTLYAKWTGASDTYTVNYNGNGSDSGSAPVDNSSYANNATVTVLGNSGNLVKTNHAFANWNTLADGSGTPYAPSSTFNIASNTTLYAQWAPISSGELYWDNTSGTANDWGVTANWSTTSGGGTTPASLPGANDVAVFSATTIQGAVQTVNLKANRSVRGLNVAPGTTNITLLGGDTDRTLTNGLAGIVNNGPGTLTVGGGANQNVALVLLGSQSIAANGSGGVTINNNVSGTGNPALSNNGAGTGYINLSGALQSTVGMIVQDSATSILSLRANNSLFNGNVEIRKGTLSIGTSSNNLGNATSGQVLLGGSGTTDAATLDINDNSSQTYVAKPIVLGTTSGALKIVLRDSGGAVYTHILTGGITGDNSLILETQGGDDKLTFNTGALNNTGTITHTGSGAGDLTINAAIGANVTDVIQTSATSKMVLTGANSYRGDTIVNAGTLSVDGDAIPNTSKLAINGGMVEASGATETVGTLFLNGVQKATGYWGSIASPASNKDDAYFTGTGMVFVATGPSIPVTYTVTYFGNGSDGGNAPVDGNSPYSSNATVTVLGNTGNLVKANHTFANWNTKTDGSGTPYAPSSTFNIASNTTLYAQWTPVSSGQLYWDNAGGTSNDWGGVANWSTVAGGGSTPASLPGTNDVAVFSATPIQGAVQTVNLNANRSVRGLNVTSVTTNITLLGGGTNRTLTNGVAGIVNNGPGALTVGGGTGQNVALVLAGSQSLAANGSGGITINNNVYGTGTPTLTNNGAGSGAVYIAGALQSNVTSVVQDSATSTLLLRGNNSAFTGNIVIKKGTIQIGSANSNLGTGGTLTLGNSAGGSDAATLEIKDSSTVSYAKALVLASTTTGLLKISLRDDSGVNTYTFTGGVTGPNALTLETMDGDDKLTFSTVSLNNSGTITHVGSGSGDLTISSVIGTNVTGLIQTSATSKMVLSGVNSYRGDTIVSNGVLAVNGSAIPDSSRLVIHSGGKVSITNGMETVATLFFGTDQQVAGTWGSSASGATHTNDTYFTGTGQVSVTNGPVAGAVTETFDNAYTTATNGWTGSGNNDYGWVNTSVVLGSGTTGAAGGVFARSASFSYFADTAIGVLNRTNTFRLAGSFRLANVNFDGQFYLGYFTPGTGSTNFIGVQFKEPNGGGSNPFRGNALVNGSGGSSSADINLPQNTTLSFDLTWVGNANGSGTLSGTLAGTNVSINVGAGGGSFTAFGLLNGGMSTSSTEATGSCYFDNLTYIKNATEPVTYTVTYDGNGKESGTAPADANSPYSANATVTVLGNTGSLARTGHTFTNWNTLANGSGASYAPSSTFSIDTNTTLYAQWTANTYTVTFDGRRGTPDKATQQVTYGQPYGTLAEVTLTNHAFNGWFTATSGGTQITSDSNVVITANQTLYAQWTPLSPLRYWDNAGATTNNDWGSAANWSTTIGGGSTPAAFPGEGDVAVFSATPIQASVQTNKLNANRSVLGLSVLPGVTTNTTLLGGGTDRTLTIGASGITKEGTGTLTIGSGTAGQRVHLTLAGSQNIANNGPATITINNNVAGTDAPTLTNNGSGTNYVGMGALQATVDKIIQDSATSILGLRLSNSAFNGDVEILKGTLSIGTGGNNLGNATSGQVLLGGSGTEPATLDINDNSSPTYVAKPIVLGTTLGTLRIVLRDDAGANTHTITGPVSGENSLTLENQASGTNNNDMLVFAGLTGGFNNAGTITHTGTGSGDLTISSVIGPKVRGVIQDSATSRMVLTGVNTYSGDTTVNAGILAVNGKAIPDTGKLAIHGGKVEPTGATETVGTLFFNGVQQVSGDWGSSASEAVHTNDTYFTGTGMVHVATGPATYSVTYDGNGSDNGSTPLDGASPYLANATVTVLGNMGNLSKADHVFEGWNTARNGSGTPYAANDTFTITEDTTLYAQWELAYTGSLYWDNAGGEGNDWGSVSNWSTSSAGGVTPPAIPGTNDMVVFSATPILFSAQTNNLNANRAVLGLNVLPAVMATTTLQGGGTTRTLTLGTNGITNGSAYGLTLATNVNIVLAGSQSIAADGSGGIALNGNVSGTSSPTLTNRGAGNGYVSMGVLQASVGRIVQDSATSTLGLRANNGAFNGNVEILKGTVLIGIYSNCLGNAASGQVILGGSSAEPATLAIIDNSSPTYVAKPIVLGTTSGLLKIALLDDRSGLHTHTLTGGITGDNDLTVEIAAEEEGGDDRLTFAAGALDNAGTITHIGTGSGDLTISAAIGTNVTDVIQASATSRMVLTGVNAYSGDTVVSAGILAVTGSAIPDTGRLVISGGQVSISNGMETVGTLFFDGIQQKKGSWGSSASAADNTNDTYFAGAGIVYVLTGPLTEAVTETFDTEALAEAHGWTGSGNRTNGHSYGWADTNAVLGADTAGVAGGVFARAVSFSYYADTGIGMFNRTNTFRLAGSFALANVDFDGNFRLGYFTPAQGSTNFVGLTFAEPSSNGSPFRCYAEVKGAVGAGSGEIPLPHNTTITFDLTWTGNADGSGTLNGTVAGTNVNVSVGAGGGSFTAFGLLGGGAGSANAGQQTGGCYFDSLTYDKFTAAGTGATQNQIVSFAAIPDQLVTRTLALDARASSGLPVEYEVTEGPGVLDGTSLSFTGSGYVTVRAMQVGNTLFRAAQPVERRFAVLTEEGILDAGGNGADDRWEQEHWPFGTPPETVTKRGRPMSLRDVFVADLDPFDPDSVLEITHLGRILKNGTWRTEVEFAPASVRRLYDLEMTPHLTNGWQRLLGDIVPDAASFKLETPESLDPQRFYRIKVRLPLSGE